MKSPRKISYRKKTRLLLGGGLALLVLIYPLTFAKTLALLTACSDLEERARIAAGASQQLAILKQEEARLDQLAGSVQQENTNTQQAVLGIVTTWCQAHQVLLKDFPETKRVTENDYLVELDLFTVEGNFSDLLGLVYRLEQKDRVAKVSSVDFKARKDPRTKKTTLTATVYLQNIRRS